MSMNGIPLAVRVRKRYLFPIIETVVQSKSDISLWIDYPLEIIKKGEKFGGRLMSESPEEKTEPNSVVFTMIFKDDQTAENFMHSLQ